LKLFTTTVLALSLSLNITVSSAEEKELSENEQLATQWMNYLVSDERQGRLTGSEENSDVQSWLIKRFETVGLEKLPGQDSYLQKFTAYNKKGEPLQAANVIGYLPCQCDSNKYFFVGAHYDHVGVNPKLEGDKIFNGADDDASGVVASLIFAKQLKQIDKLPFNVVIAAWDAEEMGLQGSKYFAQNPWVPVENIESGFMFELVGVPLKDKLNNAWMTGHEYSTLYPTLKEQLASQGWELDPVLDPKMGLFFRSDNAPFAMLNTSNEDIKKAFQEKEKAKVNGIPMHAISVWRGQDHYHQPHDDMSNIHIPNLVSLSEALAKAFTQLPESTSIEWLENSQFEFSRPKPQSSSKE
jgi:hypothetical protein